MDKRGCYYCANRTKFECKIRNRMLIFNGLLKTEKQILENKLGIRCSDFKEKKVKVELI